MIAMKIDVNNDCFGCRYAKVVGYYRDGSEKYFCTELNDTTEEYCGKCPIPEVWLTCCGECRYSDGTGRFVHIGDRSPCTFGDRLPDDDADRASRGFCPYFKKSERPTEGQHDV